MQDRRLAPSFDPRLAQRAGGHQLGEPRPRLSHRHAEVVGEVRSRAHAVCARGLQEQLPLALLALHRAGVVLGRHHPLGEEIDVAREIVGGRIARAGDQPRDPGCDERADPLGYPLRLARVEARERDHLGHAPLGAVAHDDHRALGRPQ